MTVAVETALAVSSINELRSIPHTHLNKKPWHIFEIWIKVPNVRYIDFCISNIMFWISFKSLFIYCAKYK